MIGNLDELYLHWLYSQVGDVKVRNKSRTYWDLLAQLYSKQFVWFIPNDDNRVLDGIDLRHEFILDAGVGFDNDWLARPCSILELCVALSRRLAFEGEGQPSAWFWVLMTNLGLQHCTDRPKYDQSEVDARLDAVIWRTYEPDGRGGLFPLRYPSKDQREVELWYQMNAYLLDA